MKLLLNLLVVFEIAAAPAHAQDWLSKPVRLVNPFSPGGTIDRLGRLIGARLQERWDRPVLVESMCPTRAAARRSPTSSLRGIGVSGIARSQAAPELATIAESGLPGFDITSWFGLFAPARTPKEIVDKTAHEVTTYLKLPETRAQLTAIGEDVVASSPDEFAAFMKNEIARMAQIVKASGASVD
jgi:tripartite-type tricarboxylate transporter receptor subunit TctC